MRTGFRVEHGARLETLLSCSLFRHKILVQKGEQEFRLINDDAVEGVVADPRGITRA